MQKTWATLRLLWLLRSLVLVASFDWFASPQGSLVERRGRTVRATCLCYRLEHPADLTDHRVLAFESAVEDSCDRHVDPSQDHSGEEDASLHGAPRSQIPREESSDLLAPSVPCAAMMTVGRS